MPTVVDCQSCSRKLRVPDELLGQRVKCPTCGQEFTATESHAAVPPPAAFSPGQPAPLPPSPPPPPRYDAPPRFDAPPGGFDNRAGGYDEFGERRHLRPGAQSAIAGPAIALLVVGILGALGSGFVVCAGMITMAAGNQRMGGGGNDEVANLFAFGFYGIMLIVSIAIIACAVRMRKLDSYAMAMTGSILACIPCLSPCFILGIPFGIWALVVINQQDVREAFRG